MRMTKSDVLVEELEPIWCECDQVATHRVMVDLRALGLSVEVEPWCRSCAEKRAEELRASLPDDEEDLADEHEDLVDQRVTITDAGRAAQREGG